MNNLIERYIFDVIRRLPKKERKEVSEELKANLYGMLSDPADEDEVRRVLYQLGSPAALAKKYRRDFRYLISPSLYDEYLRVLKLVLPVVGGVCLAIGMVLGAVDSVRDGVQGLPHVIGKAFAEGLTLGIEAVLHALVWTTIGFVIAERVGAKSDKRKEQEWKIEDLPEPSPDKKGKIPLSDSITELVLTVIFSIIAIFLCSGAWPFPFIIQKGGTQIYSLFNSEFLVNCIPAIVIMALLSIFECTAKILQRRWTLFVCGATVISSLTSMVILVYLLSRPHLFSVEFTTLMKSADWAGFKSFDFMRSAGISPTIFFISTIIVVISLAECIYAIFRTLKNKEKNHFSPFTTGE